MTAGGPLAGRRVVVTRSRAQANRLSEALRADGADVIEIPTIRIAPPDDYGPVDAAIERLADYDWLVFTSQNAVVAFMDRLASRGRDPASLHRLRIAAIGPATADALAAYRLRPALAPRRFVAEALVDGFAGVHALPASRVLLPRALEARSVLPDGLRQLGASVDVVPVYRVEVERDQSRESWTRLLRDRVDAVTFTSPSTVRGFVELLGAEASRVLGAAMVACIGPVTAAAARACGLTVVVVAETYTTSGLVEALRAGLGASSRRSIGAQP